METEQINETIFGTNFNTSLIEAQLNELKLFPSIPISEMGKEQQKHSQLSLLYELVNKESKPKLSQIYWIRSKLVRKMLSQFDKFLIIKGVLHHYAILNGKETQQLVLPSKFRNKILTSIHDDSGHQGLKRTLELLQS